MALFSSKIYKTFKFDVSLELCEYCVLPWKLVAPPFHYVEKGDKNDGNVSYSVTATLLFCLVNQETNFLWQKFHEILQNLVYFAKQNFAKFREINIKISRN
jgi:hypothetical protein